MNKSKTAAVCIGACAMASLVWGCGEDTAKSDVADAASAADATSSADAGPAVTKTVGSEGGTIETAGGTAITIPPGALGDDVEITVETVPDDTVTATLPADTLLTGDINRFTPHGTTFASPVTIALPFSGSANTVLKLDDDNDTTWEVVPGATFASGVASFETSSFSLYSTAEETITCGPATTGTAGSVSLTGASFTAMDAVAVVTHDTDIVGEGGTIPFLLDMRIILTNHGNACGLENDGIRSQGFQRFDLRVTRASDTAIPDLPVPGTYDYAPFESSILDGTTQFIGGGESNDCNNDCEVCAGFATNISGSVTLTAVSATSVEGTFTYAYNASSYSGSFTAPICGSTDPDAAYCCLTP